MALDRVTDGAAETNHPDELPPGTALLQGQYRIGSYLNSGGFGIAYLAHDSLDRQVVLKECFVSSFCSRVRTQVTARSDNSRIHLKKVMGSFVNEARTLAALSHPNIVRVHQLFEENDTAYMAMDYVEGRDLLDIIDDGEGGLRPDRIVEITRKMISALGHIHDRQVLHCDISPDNICLRPDGEPVLIDFGSARRHVAGTVAEHPGFSLVKDGYSACELYETDGHCGPWSDIYSLGATLFHAISGAPPVDGQTRHAAVTAGRPDPYQPLAGRFDGYPRGFLESVDRAMAVRPSERHLSAADWLRRASPVAVAPERPVILIRRPAASEPARPLSA
jgi:serine/threonine protein kinase